MDFDSGMPIYAQIVSAFKQRIAAGHLPPGERVASVRDLALDYGVNPNTMQKALAALESEGLLYSERTSGRYVTQDIQAITSMRSQMLREEIGRFVSAITSMGYHIRDALPLLEEYHQ